MQLVSPQKRRPLVRPSTLRALAAVALGVAALAAASVPAGAAEERSDVFVQAAKPRRLEIARGRSEASRSFPVVVRNANQRTVPGPGSGPLTVALSASALDCPAGTVVGAPDFVRATPGSQSTATLAQGASARGTFSVTVQAADVATPTTRTPVRCRVRLAATVLAPAGNVDPRQTNDATILELDLVDRNDAAPPPPVELVTKPVRPLRVALDAPHATRALSVTVELRNAAASAVVATLDGDDGDCPAGTLASLDADAATPGVQASVTLGAGRTARARLQLSARPPVWSTAGGRSPARCAVRVRVGAPLADAEPSNDEIAVTIDTSVADASTGTGCAAWASPATPAGTPPSVLGELSGLAASRRHRGVYWAHNDSGNDFELYALAADGTLLETYELDGATAVDIEDVAVARCSASGEQWCVYLADIGDNGAVRSQVSIYKLPEPDLGPGQSLTVEKLPFTYPGGPRDAESLVAETLSGRLFVISKILTSLGQVFRLDGLGAPGGGTATPIATLGPTTPADVWATAADAHPSGETVLVRTYSRVWELRAPGALTLEEVFARTPAIAVAASQPQGEAIAFAQDGLGYFIATEQLAPTFRVGCQP